MAFARLPINSLSGGVGRQVPTKRLATEAENIDNCLVTLEKSIEKRPPLTRVACNGLSYLNIPYPHIPSHTPNFNEDHLYFHFLDIDGYNRYCIVINRAGYEHNPVTQSNFTYNGKTINLTGMVNVFRIEPTEWIPETVDSSVGATFNTSGFNRGIFEYITYGNKAATSDYYIAGTLNTNVEPSKTKDTFGSIDYNVGFILWNKLVPLDFLPNNANYDLNPADLGGGNFFSTLNKSNYIHSGDTISYKTTDGKQTNTSQYNEDNSENTSLFWPNVRDDIVFEIDPETLEETEQGQNLETFDVIPQYPFTEVKADVGDSNGFKAFRMLYHYYDNPFIIDDTTLDFSKDHYYLTSPLTKLQRDDNLQGWGKVYYTRNPYLTFPVGFYRATRYSKNPYFERIRSEEEKSVFDHRRFPIYIYKDTDGVWRVKHLEVQARRSGTPTTNPGPTSVNRKDKIQSMAFWKNRLWVATDSTVFSSQATNYFNFWINDIQNITETDPIDILANVGSYNKLSHIIPFQSIMFVSTAGTVQFEIRGGSADVGISPFNVEFRPTSFFSTSKLTMPERMGNNVFFLDSGKLFMYLGGASLNDEYSTSIDMSTHCKGYLPTNIGTTEVSSSTNTLLFTDEDNKNILYLYTLRTSNNQITQNAFYRWILSTEDSILGLKTFEKDLYIVSKRPSGINGGYILTAYFVSLETTPITTPMIDWLHTVQVADMVYYSSSQNTVLRLNHYDPDINYVIKSSDVNWDNEAYEPIPIDPETQITVSSVNGVVQSFITVPGNLTKGPVYVGHSYEMNVELSQQVRRAEDTAQVYEGVLNLKRMTTRHFESGAYDIEIERKGRESTKTTFFPLDTNNILTRTDQLKIDTNGEHYTRILSFSDACKIFIKSSYPTPCNITNIEILGNFRLRNTSIE
jgi:hypothetical protein